MKALVTGAGGFLGGAVARQLVDRGFAVRHFSRRSYAQLDELSIEQHVGELDDQRAVLRAVDGCDIVFHVAAKAGAWGAYREYLAANVTGTQYLLDACRQHGLPRFVYTSSPSVVFDGRDMEGVDESVPYASHYEAHYPRTKAAGEQAVLKANSAELRTVAVRPHLIWGPGDTNLVPRILQRARSGQLRRLSGPQKRVDTTYIDDAAAAHLNAADALDQPDSPAAGRAYFISSGQPVPIWDMVNRFLHAAQLPPLQRSISPRAAVAVGATCEAIHWLFRRSGEPRMTRWVARELATAHWFNIDAARRDLGYEPSVTLDEGIERLSKWLAEAGPRA